MAGNNIFSVFTYVNPYVKYTMFFFNFLIWVIGGVIFSIGAWSFLEEEKYTLPSDVQNYFIFITRISVVIMVFGGTVFLLSFAGCLGALRENLCLLNIYSYCLLILFLGEAVLIAVAFILPNKILEPLKKSLSTEPIIKYRDDVNLQNLIDTVQQKFKCCGVSDKGFRDWSKNPYFNCNESNPSRERCGVPYSCCKNPMNLQHNLINIMCGYDVQKEASAIKVSKTVYVRGCIDAFQDHITENIYSVTGVIIAIAVLQLFASCLSRMLLDQVEAQISQQ